MIRLAGAVLVLFALGACSSDGAPSSTDDPTAVLPTESAGSESARPFALPSASGGEFSYPEDAGDAPALLYFSMGPGCPPCIQQIADLQQSSEFAATGVRLISISPDPVEQWAATAQAIVGESLMLSDRENLVASQYDVMQWRVGNEPGHTFVVVDADGVVRAIRDYGAPENGGLMYVPVDEIIEFLRADLQLPAR